MGGKWVESIFSTTNNINLLKIRLQDEKVITEKIIKKYLKKKHKAQILHDWIMCRSHLYIYQKLNCYKDFFFFLSLSLLQEVSESNMKLSGMEKKKDLPFKLRSLKEKNKDFFLSQPLKSFF